MTIALHPFVPNGDTPHCFRCGYPSSHYFHQAIPFDGPEPWRAHGRDRPFDHAYIGGTFDCLHRGHLALFANAKKIARWITVSVNTDDFATRYKRRPLMPFEDRMAVLMALNDRLVDHVIANTGGADSAPAIDFASAVARSRGGEHVDAIVHGADWFGESLMRQLGLSQHWLDVRGIKLVMLPDSHHIISTTEILERYTSDVKAAR